MTDTTELDTYVQTCLKDWSISPHRRAKMAVERIEAHARAEENLTDDEPLPIPLEWEHRVPTEGDVAIKVEPPIIAVPGIDYTVTDDEPTTIAYEPEPVHGSVEAEAEAIVQEAFHVLDAEKEAKFKEFWETDRDD